MAKQTRYTVRRDWTPDIAEKVARALDVKVDTSADTILDTSELGKAIERYLFKQFDISAPVSYTPLERGALNAIQQAIDFGANWDVVNQMAAQFENQNQKALSEPIEKWLSDNKPADKKPAEPANKQSSGTSANKQTGSANAGQPKTGSGSAVKK